MKIITLALPIALTLVELAQAEPRKRDSSHRTESRNYIIRRQQAYQVQGVPIRRLIIGKREIDIYRDGSMYGKDNLVGYDKR